MKKILGLDLGTTSIGWALVEEDQTKVRNSKIIKLGVRVNPLTTDEQTDFEKGRPLSVNADRTLKRGARRNLQRFKLRRENLIEILIKHKIISKKTILTEIGKNTTFQTLELRAKATKERIKKEEFVRVLLTINKKRGYKSSRKAKNEEEGNLIDGMSVAKELYDNNFTVGQYVYQLLEKGGTYIPDFYRSDLQSEFDAIWNFQKQFYPNILIDKLYDDLQGKNKGQTWKICEKPFQLEGNVQQKGSVKEKKKERYQWRSEAISKQFDLEHLVIILQEINNNLNNSSGYLGAISDRSKELFFNKETVGENLYKQIQNNSHTSLKNQVFYRQDYLDEFEQIWETQAKFHTELTNDLKEEIRDVIIFYQRKLKSQKHLISNCEFEKYHKAIPKSALLFQEFKIWQNLNNLELRNKETNDLIQFISLDEDIKQAVFDELNLRGNLKFSEIFKTLSKFLKLGKINLWKTNFKELEGNRTNQAIYNVYQTIADNEGYGFDWSKKTASEIKEELKRIFLEIKINTNILDFNTELSSKEFENQESFKLWHLLYATEDDEKIKEEDKLIYGNSNVVLKKNLHQKFGFIPKYASMLVNVSFQQDYGSLSSRAIKKILPYLKAGHQFSEASKFAGYNHSHSLTKDELENRSLKDKLPLFKKNSLRNPVVEKILNQMVNVINQVIETYGKPDEIRIELARELKKSAKERSETTKNINKSKTQYEGLRKLLKKDFGIKNPTRNDIIKYRLYEELVTNSHHTLYTNKYIPKEKLFSQEIEIEHIIAKAKLFDDSFSNKTLAYSKPNKDKGSRTALDFITNDFNDDLDNYTARVENLYKKGNISKAKRNKLLMTEKNIPDGFIERDLRDSQYIAKKAKELLETVIRTVNTTTGSVTNRLRNDWDLINVMQELNLPKFKMIDENLIEQVEKKDGTFKTRIKNWNKRNDHRHHAMDALTVAFTKHSHVQYLNNLKAKSDKKGAIYGIQEKETYVTSKGRRKFISPMPNFREEAKREIESVLISFKAKNKVVTRNKNKIKGKEKHQIVLTPRGKLHKETVYGKINEAIVKMEKVNAKFDVSKINQVTKPNYRDALLIRLKEFDNDAKKAFTGKNTLIKNPIYLDNAQLVTVPETVKTKSFETIYTIRKPITPDLKIDKIIDVGTKEVLERRLEEFNGKPKEAFSNLEKNPIWINKEKGISIKRVTISGIKNAEALHVKKDHLGNEILKDNKVEEVDFVSTGNNHHVAIYEDEKGKLQEKVVSFYEAVINKNLGLSVVNKDFNKEKGWQFLFTMKQNEMFVFPFEDFNPKEIDLLDKKNRNIISKYLFRVQKISTKNYMFAHHLETKVITNEILKEQKQLSGHLYHSIRSTEPLRNIVKVRINHLGEIVQVNEY